MRSVLARLEAYPWAVLAAAMAIAAVVILEAGSGLTFSGDDLYYFGRSADIERPPVHYDSLTLEYLFAPHNGHLQVGGKLVYEGMFALFGADYAPFRVLELLLVLVSIALFFELARTRIGAPAALLLAVLLCFLGAAWEPLLWAFDMHTVGALAAGLGALLVLERGGRHSDLLACTLLIVSIAFVEVGVAFIAGVGVSILIRPDRWRRLWIAAIPLLVFAAWWLWARRFDIEAIGLGAAGDVPGVMFDSLRAVLASLTGRIPTGDGVPVPVVGLTTFGGILAVAALALFALRLRRGSLPPTIWPLLATLLTYWTFIGLAERPPDSSRYMFAAAILVLLVAADAVRDRRPGPLALGVLALVVALAIPGNLAKLQDGGDYLARDGELIRSEFAMFELAGERADPEYISGYDPASRSVGASPHVVMTPPQYLETARRIGSLADPLDVVRQKDHFLRRVDDVVLARALGLEMEPTTAAAVAGLDCATAERAHMSVEAPPGGLVVEALEPGITLSLSRFQTEGPAFELGELDEGQAVRIELPGEDAAPEPWRLFYDGRVRACALP